MSNSYEQRRDIFRAADGSFDGLPRTFIGPLYHDLMICGTGIPPVNPIPVGLWNDVNGRAGAIMAPINFKPYGSCQRFVSVKNLF